MIVYVYSKCSTCQKAISYLNENQVHFVRKEITETPPTIQELRTMLQHLKGNIRKLFNTSGQLYRELKIGEKLSEMPVEHAISLLNQNGMLVKRPFILSDNFGFTGFTENEKCQLGRLLF